MGRADDRWLSRWLDLIGERAAGLPLLELGCGGGRDTAVLVEVGLRVVADSDEFGRAFRLMSAT